MQPASSEKKKKTKKKKKGHGSCDHPKSPAKKERETVSEEENDKHM